MKIRAILFGGTGMVGEGVLLEALKSEAVESVLVVGRRPCGVAHAKVREVIHDDFLDFSAIENRLAGYDACFFCLGITSVGMSEQEYTRITCDISLRVATTLSRLNPGMTFCFVSGTGADSTEQGRVMWARVKGKAENQVAQLPFKAVYIFRPGLMKPTKGQRNVKPIFKILGMLYPFFMLASRNYACKLEEVGNAMIEVAQRGYAKRILDNADIALAARGARGGK